MGQLLTILGIDAERQQGLPKKIFQAEELITGMQGIYENTSEGKRKDSLADAMSEMIRIMLIEVSKTTTEKKKEEEENVAELITPKQDEEEEHQMPKKDEEPPQAPKKEETKPEAPKKEKSTPKALRKEKRAKTSPKQIKEEEDNSEYATMSLDELEETLEEIRGAMFLYDETEEDYKELENEKKIIQQYINKKND